MELVVRTWNLFHGRTVPEGSRLQLQEMVRRISAGHPDVVCLQEVPVWALHRLGGWSGLAVYGSVAMPPRGGPLARWLTDRDPRRLRSALTGQANAILFSESLAPGERVAVELNPAWFRDREAARLGLSASERSAWPRNRRVAQLLRLTVERRTVVVLNAHLTSPADSRMAGAELARCVAVARTFANPDEPLILAGDLNLTASGSPAFGAVKAAGFSAPSVGIDHLLVRGLELVRGPAPWPEEERRLGDALLSDHAPLEARMIVP